MEKNRLLSPVTKVSKLSLSPIQVEEQSPLIENLIDMLNRKVRIAKASRFSGLRSPDVLRRKSRQFQSIERGNRESMVYERCLGNKKYSNLLDVDTVEKLSPHFKSCYQPIRLES